MSDSADTLNYMITGALKNNVDRIWDTFWSGGISNPVSVIEQFTYLLFIKDLDERQVQIDKRRALGDPTATEDIFTKVRGIRLNVDAGTGQEDHNIDCKIDGFGAMKLKPAVVKKV